MWRTWLTFIDRNHSIGQRTLSFCLVSISSKMTPPLFISCSLHLMTLLKHSPKHPLILSLYHTALYHWVAYHLPSLLR